MMRTIFSEPYRRIKSSSSARKKCELPGSPCRAQRPRSWRSMRRASCRSVPSTWSPPRPAMPSPNRMSVPRPAMFVAIVTLPCWPALATISASCWWNFAFNTECIIFSRLRSLERCSLVSTAIVPTRIGRPAPCISLISSTTALNFSRLVL